MAIKNNEVRIPLRTPVQTVELVTNVDEWTNDTKVNIYPNPTTEFVYIRQNEPAQTNIEVYDITGKKVYYSDFYGAITKVDVVGLNLGNGTYIVKLTTDKEIKTAKFNVIK